MKVNLPNYWTHNGTSTDIETVSISELKDKLNWAGQNAIANKKSPNDVPVYIRYNGCLHELNYVSFGAGKNGLFCEIEVGEYDKIQFVAPDSRPEEGEYWKSRGIGGSDANPDCSGFVVSKPAGERLRRMVRLVLESDDTKSWLDYRESEPNWIQFKFSGHEFDLEKLNQLSRENENVVTLEILRQCKLEKTEE